MADTVTSPNMTLTVPVPSVAPGPLWAQSIYTCLYANIDQHNHSPGQGVQIQPSGINISSSLSFNNNSAISLKTTSYQDQGSSLSSSFLGAVYMAGGNLYFNAGSDGFAVQITNGHTVNGSSGTIGGLPSGTASANYAAGTFVFQSATNTAANIDGGSVLIRNTTASSNAITLSAPNALAANYPLVLPTGLPGAQSFVTLDNSGNLAAGSIPVANGITRANQAAVGQQVSASCGFFGGQATSPTDITNMSVTITTTGRPVIISVQPDGGSSSGFFDVNNNTITTAFLFLQLVRDSTVIAVWQLAPPHIANTVIVVPASLYFLDAGATAATHTYKMQYSVNAATSTAVISQCVIAAYEL